VRKSVFRADTDPDPAFFVNADPDTDPDPDPGVLTTKNLKKFTAEKKLNIFDRKLQFTYH
jgi:hypothetical protein